MNAKHVLIGLAALLLLSSAGWAVAATTGGPTMQRWVIAGGGAHGEAGSYTLDVTIGQAVTGIVDNAPAVPYYELCSGHWCFLGPSQIFLPVILRRG